MLSSSWLMHIAEQIPFLPRALLHMNQSIVTTLKLIQKI